MTGSSAVRTTRARKVGVGACSISSRAKELVNQVLASNRLSAGPMTLRLEQQIAALHGGRFGLMCNSGTSALQIALAALKEREGWREGDEVLVPALTFVATANVVFYNQLKPVFVDVDPVYFEADPASIERHLTARTRAILPVHIAGLPCEMDPMIEIATRHKLHIVEDSAECMFARYKGRPVGSFSTIACFSSYVAHIMSTGVGGFCVTNDPEYHNLLRSLMNHGRDAIYTRIDDDADLMGERLHQTVQRRFSFVRFGHSFRATELEAALGIAELECWRESWARRQKIAAALTGGLADLDQLQLPSSRPDAEHAFMFYPIVVRQAGLRDALVNFLEDEGVETRQLLPLINQPIYRQIFGDLDACYPVAARLNASAFYIGCHSEMTADDVEYVISVFHQFFRNHD